MPKPLSIKARVTARGSTTLVADSSGAVMDLPGFEALAQNGSSVRSPYAEEVIPLPKGAHLYLLPDRIPLARKNGRALTAEGIPVAAILPQGYTRTLLPAYEHPEGVDWLPYFGYAACFFQHDQIFVGAIDTGSDPKWDPKSFSEKILKQKITKRLAKEPEDRILSQVARCASDYHCYTAANIFFERWEGALPVSPSCNSVCRGCISKADDPGPPSPQERFTFVPAFGECVRLVRSHFENADQPIISFGQGCEGEPSLQSDLVVKIILNAKPDYPNGQFNMNTNGSKPKEMERLYRAGLDSIRVSLNSAQEAWYDAYYRPKNYQFDDLRKTIRIAKTHGVFVSLNLLCFPGVTDHPRESEAFFEFLTNTKPDLIQMRNLNIDPWRYLKECIQENVTGIGMANWISCVRKEFPAIQIGNFTPYIKRQVTGVGSPRYE